MNKELKNGFRRQLTQMIVQNHYCNTSTLKLYNKDMRLFRCNYCKKIFFCSIDERKMIELKLKEN